MAVSTLDSTGSEFQRWSFLRRYLFKQSGVSHAIGIKRAEIYFLNLGGTAGISARPLWGEFFYFSQFYIERKKENVRQNIGIKRETFI